MRNCVGTLVFRMTYLAASVAALALGCEDSVDPGFYGPDDKDAGPATSPVGVASSPTGAEATGSGSHGGRSDDSGSDATTTGDAPGEGKPAGPCDLGGRWLVALRTVTDALGTKQAAHEWYYYELTQSGTQVTVSKGLLCGKNVRALSAASGNADFPKAWSAMAAKVSVTGRNGVSSPTSGGCQVSFPPVYEVMAATESYYADPGHALPSSSQQASGSTPGWEDWDQDGQPGYTMSITGIASGQIYMVDRTRYALSGTIAASPGSFNLAVDWSSEQDVLGINGPPILSMTASAVKDSDASQHFATFARLTASQATGDDASVCTAIRLLAPTLAPDASN